MSLKRNKFYQNSESVQIFLQHYAVDLGTNGEQDTLK